MKISFRSLVAITSIACLAIAARAADAGFVDFGKFQSAHGRQFVQVDVGRGLLRFAGLIARCSEHEAADVISGLTRVRVNVIGLDETNRESTTHKVQEIRRNLAAQGWDPVVTAKDKGDDVAIFVKQRSDDVIEGVVVTVLGRDESEAVLINVVGALRADQVARLGEHLEIKQLKHTKHVVKL